MPLSINHINVTLRKTPEESGDLSLVLIGETESTEGDINAFNDEMTLLVKTANNTLKTPLSSGVISRLTLTGINAPGLLPGPHLDLILFYPEAHRRRAEFYPRSYNSTLDQ